MARDCLIACAACQMRSSTMRSCGASLRRYCGGGFGRDTRLPVAGSLIIRTLFQTIFPIELVDSMPWPRAALPLMVDAFHLPPRGGMRSALSAAAIARGAAGDEFFTKDASPRVAAWPSSIVSNAGLSRDVHSHRRVPGVAAVAHHGLEVRAGGERSGFRRTSRHQRAQAALKPANLAGGGVNADAEEVEPLRAA